MSQKLSGLHKPFTPIDNRKPGYGKALTRSFAAIFILSLTVVMSLSASGAVFGEKLANSTNSLLSLLGISQNSSVSIPFDDSFTLSNQYSQGFETNNIWGDPPTDPVRVASGTNGITSKTGGFHAEAVAGNFTRWGGYSSTFPASGYTTSVDIYLDVNGAYSNNTRFDYSSAINNTAGTHRRDFIFTGGYYNDAVAPGSGPRFVVSASNNSPGNPKDPARDPFVISTSGWYTFTHRFYNNGSGVLAVQLSITNAANNVIHTWTLSDPSDVIGSTVGGNRYGWFVTNGFPFLAIDNSARANIIQDAPITVTQNDLVYTPFSPTGWFFYQDKSGIEGVNNSLGSFVNGPGTPPLGNSSVQISTSSDSRPNLATYQFSGTPLAQITELKFSTYNPSAGNGGGSANRSGYLHFNVDFNGSDTWQRRLVYVPADNGTVTPDTWKEWDAINNGNAVWKYSGGNFPAPNPTASKTWAQILADYPGVRMRVTDSFFGIRVGEPYADGYTENIDAVKVGIAGDNKVFNFERSPVTIVDADGFASATDCNNSTTPAATTIAAAVAAAQPGDTIRVCSGTYPIPATVNLNKAGLTILGVGASRPVIQIPTSTGYGFAAYSPNVTLQNLEIVKSDLGTGHNLIYIGANNFTAQNNLIYGPNPGGTWTATGIISRAFEATGGLSGLLIQNNTIHTLRQGAYINPGTTGSILNNNLSGTKGWNIDGAIITFNGNTFGEPQNQDCDIALYPSVNPANYPPLLTLSSNNDNAFICAQYAGGENGRAIAYVDDNAAPNGNGSDNTNYQSINTAVNGTLNGGTVQVAAGGYNEDVLVGKSVIINGAGVNQTTVNGVIGGDTATFRIAANNVEIRNLKITRVGNNPTDWYNPNLNSAGVAVQGTTVTGLNLHDNLITGNRSGIDINNSNGHTIRNNVITDNRTGLIFRNQTDNLTVVENEITNNWTLGIVFLDGSGGTNTPVNSAANSLFFNNNLSGNWYGQVVERQSGGSLPAPGTTNLKNFGGNWFGSTAPVVTTANSTEPGYGSSGDPNPLANIPVAYGGTAVSPGGQPDIAGPASGNIDFSPFLNSSADTNVQTTPGRGTYGFQGSFSALNVSAASPQTNGTLSNIQEGINMVTAGGTLNIQNGTYSGNVNINKVLTLKGTPTILGTLTASVAGARISPGFSPGIINSGDLTLTPGSFVDIELNGTTAGTGYDQINVTGAVNLNGATLNVTNGFTPPVGSAFTIINNDNNDSVLGTFAGLPEGTTFFVGVNSYRISYIGGTGNDVVLTAVSLCNTVSIPTGITTPTGTTVTVPVNVDDTTDKGLLSFDFTVNYNPSVINTPSVSLTPLTSGRTLTVNNTTPGTIVISVYGATPLMGSGALLNITFNVVGNIGTSSGLNFSSFIFNEGTPCLSTSNGSVNVVGGTISGLVTYANSATTKPVPGTNLNGSGSVNVSTTTDVTGAYNLSGFGPGAYTVTPSKTGDINAMTITSNDSARIAQHVAGLLPLNAVQLIVADVSDNGTVTSFDAALIARYAVLLPNSGSAGTWRFSPVSRSYPSGVASNISGENYTAYLMGDVTGNWSSTITMLAPFVEELRDEDRVKVIMPQMKAVDGSTVLIPVGVTDTSDKGIISYQFDLVYDHQTLEPAEALADLTETLSSGMTVTFNQIRKNTIRVAVYGITPLEGKGTLLNLKFKVSGGDGASSSLKIENFMFNENTQLAAPVDGEIKVTSDESVTVEGQLLTPTGAPISKTGVIMTDSRGGSRKAVSDDTGLFRFSGLTIGETYTVSVNSKRYTFTPQAISPAEGLTKLNLIAEP